MMTGTQDGERLRSTQRDNWTAAAPGWKARRDDMGQNTRPVTDALLAAARIAHGQRVLDLACGVGDPAFAIASAVGPNGSVLGLDITPAMVEHASSYGKEHGIANAEFRAIKSETDLGVPATSFDAATCRFGLMFMPDPGAALRAIHDALKPGARVAVATWGPPERTPFFTFLSDILGRHVELPKADPTQPTPFTLPTPDAVKRVLAAGGFADLDVRAFNVSVVTAPDAEAYWEQTAKFAGPMVNIIAKLPPEKQAAVRDDVIRETEARFGKGPVALGGECLIGSGVKKA